MTEVQGRVEAVTDVIAQAAIDRPPLNEVVDAAIGFSLLAPSARNTQPWSFSRPRGAMLKLTIDSSRDRPIADPSGRESMISCGVALRYLELALNAVGVKQVISLFPNPSAPALLATLRLADEYAPPSADALELVRAESHRRTNWSAFLPDPASPGQLAELADAAGGVGFIVVDSEHRKVVNALITSADAEQLKDDQLVRELHRGRGRDQHRHFGLRELGAADADGTLLVLATGSDDRLSWLQTGRALASVLLTATRLGLACTFMNQPVQVPAFRDELARALSAGEVRPQIVLRVGHPLRDATDTPRRFIADVCAPLVEPW